MIIPIAQLISEEDLQTIAHLIKDGEFEDGKLTAGWHAREIKNNLQLANDAHLEKINQLLMKALKKSDLFEIVTHPKYVRPFLVSKCVDNGGYGAHIDNPIMYGLHASRTDISMTIFLNDPTSYDGGELVMEETSGDHKFKLPAGCAVLYPSTTLHRVEPVTKGERLVACTWIQSRIRNAQQREILFDLDTARRDIYKKEGKSREFDLISKSHANLIRMWADL